MGAEDRKLIGDYQLLEEVGAGGLGRVYKAVDLKSGHYVAIKMLHDKFTKSRKFLGIFHRELLIISRLKHKNIVCYLDGSFEPPGCYIVTEFVEGYSLYHLMKLTGKVPPLIALCILIDMLQGIDYLHLHDTVHADLSSPNVLLDKHGRVLVTDFGLACDQQIETYKHYMVGTPGYYSPEHVTDAAICPPTDLYCASLIFYELLTGKKAVPSKQDRHEVLYYMKKIDFSNFPIRDRKMHSMVKKLLKKGLQLNINKRYNSAEHMMYDVYSILKRFNIRYARHAIFQYLYDNNLTKSIFKGTEQDIYKGSE